MVLTPQRLTQFQFSFYLFSLYSRSVKFTSSGLFFMTSLSSFLRITLPKAEYFTLFIILSILSIVSVLLRTMSSLPSLFPKASLNWSEQSACAALGCWHKRRWALFLIYYSSSCSCLVLLTTAIQNHRRGCRRVSNFCMGS